jgi:hypothetical protein
MMVCLTRRPRQTNIRLGGARSAPLAAGPGFLPGPVPHRGCRRLVAIDMTARLMRRR